jgi:STE24 endopeptidase
MGHYVLNHVWKGIIYFTIVFGFAFAVLHWLFDRALARWGGRLKLVDRADPAALPLIIALVSLIFFVLTPVTNSITRTMEIEADSFGYNAAREPQAFALSAMRLSTYRKIRPGPLEEVIFYDHPSGYARVHAAMVWLKENQSAVPSAAEVATPTAVPATADDRSR